MEEQTEVIELEGEPFSPWRQKRINDRADALYEYLSRYAGERFTQDELCEALGLGTDGAHLREAVCDLERRGKLAVDRSHRPHRYTTKETA